MWERKKADTWHFCSFQGVESWTNKKNDPIQHSVTEHFNGLHNMNKRTSYVEKKSTKIDGMFGRNHIFPFFGGRMAYC